MKKWFMKSLVIAVAAIFLLSVFGAINIKPAKAASIHIWTEPSTISYTTETMPASGRFNVSFWIETDIGIGGVQVTPIYEHGVINVTRWFEPTWDTNYIFFGQTTSASPTPPKTGYIYINETHSKAKQAVNLFPTPPDQPAFKGTGLVYILEFEIVDVPDKYETLDSLIYIDTDETYVMDEAGVKRTDFPKDGAYYSLEWAMPPAPYMGVEPTLVEYDQFTDAPGQVFQVDLYIKNLAEAWHLTNASFKLVYNATIIDVIGDMGNVSIAPIWGTYTVTFHRDSDPAVLDYIEFVVKDPTETPGGTTPADELVASVNFTVLLQMPGPPVGYIESPLDFTDVSFYDTVGPITPDAPINGIVRIWNRLPLPLPWFESVPEETEFGPCPEIGTQFKVDIVLTGPDPTGLHYAWYAIGWQLRLLYDAEYFEVVNVEEGPFLKDGPWNLHGTFFTSRVESDGVYGTHIVMAEMLLPNASTGEWDMTVWPNGTGVIATITFEIIRHDYPDNTTDSFDLTSVFGNWLISKDGTWIPVNETQIVNGTVTIYGSPLPGRQIDLYGGANNAGYGASSAFPAPYGGQGPNNPMDLVIPQSEVYLYALVTYNCWPVQSKIVSFEIQYPNGTAFAKFTAITNASGIASITFRMPWPCDNPEDLFGVWKVTATVSLADVLITDTMEFHYDYMVRIWKVTTDKYTYNHEEYVQVTVEYGTHAQQSYPGLFTIVITDELGVPIGLNASYSFTIGGAVFCQYNNASFRVSIFIPKWAYAGYAYVHVNCYDKEPADGGFAWCPEYAPAPEIFIAPL